ncbi:hypothetical protein [Dietzia sp. 179-F 9C3 NHS]|uniref:hypothetical protein n=1 Tax=Dietzia sp. 179-F 9C3 NHS TaxID=3374295 RepID=UPI00387A7525
MTAPPPESTVTFPWAAFVRDIVAAAVIALVIGALCYHFLSHQSWGGAAHPDGRAGGCRIRGRRFVSVRPQPLRARGGIGVPA